MLNSLLGSEFGAAGMPSSPTNTPPPTNAPPSTHTTPHAGPPPGPSALRPPASPPPAAHAAAGHADRGASTSTTGRTSAPASPTRQPAGPPPGASCAPTSTPVDRPVRPPRGPRHRPRRLPRPCPVPPLVRVVRLLPPPIGRSVSRAARPPAVARRRAHRAGPSVVAPHHRGAAPVTSRCGHPQPGAVRLAGATVPAVPVPRAAHLPPTPAAHLAASGRSSNGRAGRLGRLHGHRDTLRASRVTRGGTEEYGTHHAGRGCHDHGQGPPRRFRLR